MDGLTNGADRLRKTGDIMVGRHIAGFKMHFSDPQIIPSDETKQDFGQEPAFFLAKPCRDPEVNGDNCT